MTLLSTLTATMAARPLGPGLVRWRRRADECSFPGNTITNTFIDQAMPAGTAYLYLVRAVLYDQRSDSSEAALATTVMFLDDPLEPRTMYDDEHILQLRTAVNAVRHLASQPVASFTDSSVDGEVTKPVTSKSSALQLR